MSDDKVVDQVLIDAATAPEADTHDTEREAIEKEARAQGWAPKEEFRGKETDWIDADIFVQRGREINPILRKNNERLQKEIDKYKKDLEDLRISVDEFKKFTKEANEKKLANYETELASLREQKKQAISSGDGELAVQLDDQMDAVKEAKAAAKEDAKEKPKAEATATVNPEIEAWVAENKWYSRSKAMAATTNEIAQEIRDKYPFYSEAQFLEELDKELEQTFTPEKLGRKAKAKNPIDAGDGERTRSSGGTKGRTYNDLPADAKAACDDFVKQGIFKNKDEYLKEYQW